MDGESRMLTSPAPTILLADDDPNDVWLLRRAMRRVNDGSSLQVVEDGEAAIAYLAGRLPYADRQRFPLPALLLLDLKLPRRTGHEVLAWLRQEPGLKRLPVVMFPSSREPADVNRAYDLGVNSYLVKPVGADTLVSLLRLLHRYWLGLNVRPDLQPT
jgi:CheY-like chemotaxis protein